MIFGNLIRRFFRTNKVITARAMTAARFHHSVNVDSFGVTEGEELGEGVRLEIGAKGERDAVEVGLGEREVCGARVGVAVSVGVAEVDADGAGDCVWIGVEVGFCDGFEVGNGVSEGLNVG